MRFAIYFETNETYANETYANKNMRMKTYPHKNGERQIRHLHRKILGQKKIKKKTKFAHDKNKDELQIVNEN